MFITICRLLIELYFCVVNNQQGNRAVRTSKRFILIGGETFQNVASGITKESFETVEELKSYAKMRSYRPEYLEVFDREIGKEIELEKFELV